MVIQSKPYLEIIYESLADLVPRLEQNLDKLQSDGGEDKDSISRVNKKISDAAKLQDAINHELRNKH
jgi:hypothetical protein